MMILGKFVKQPAEIESYSIDYSLKLAETDSISSLFCSLVDIEVTKDLRLAYEPGGIVLSAGVTALCQQSVTLSNLPIGAMVSIANVGNSALTVTLNDTTLVMPERHSRIFKMTATGWVVIAALRASIVDSPTNKVVKCFVEFGEDGQNLQAEITATSSEGRVMQSEFNIRIKEV